jgi:hypothetical protein
MIDTKQTAGNRSFNGGMGHGQLVRVCRRIRDAVEMDQLAGGTNP